MQTVFYHLGLDYCYQLHHLTTGLGKLNIKIFILCIIKKLNLTIKNFRYRTEGYAVIPLPVLPGSYKFNIPTWRPTGSIINTLRRFFTGGTYELEDITHCSIPKGHEDKMLNKSYLNVTPSGYIKLNMDIIHQTHGSIKQDDHLNYFQRLSTDKLMTNIDNIFEQFKAARERMLQIKNLNI